MTRFQLSIDSDNDALSSFDRENEIARILREVAHQLVNESSKSRAVYDFNGNTVGRWSLEVCACSEDDGPCEDHTNVLVQREGASLRTADELNLIYITDALDIDAGALGAYGQDVYDRASEALAEGGWIEDAELAEELTDLTDQVENYIADANRMTIRDDGYRIVEVTGGPLYEN